MAVDRLVLRPSGLPLGCCAQRVGAEVACRPGGSCCCGTVTSRRVWARVAAGLGLGN